MARFLVPLILLVIVGYGLWPYYSLFRLDSALATTETSRLTPLIDLAAIRAHYEDRIGDSVGGLVPQGDTDTDKVLGWIASSIEQLGSVALDQTITPGWVHDTLRNAVRRASGAPDASLINAVDFAFFEAWDQFVIRLGKLGADPTFIVMTLEQGEWRVTDITG